METGKSSQLVGIELGVGVLGCGVFDTLRFCFGERGTWTGHVQTMRRLSRGTVHIRRIVHARIEISSSFFLPLPSVKRKGDFDKLTVSNVYPQWALRAFVRLLYIIFMHLVHQRTSSLRLLHFAAHFRRVLSRTLILTTIHGAADSMGRKETHLTAPGIQIEHFISRMQYTEVIGKCRCSPPWASESIHLHRTLNLTATLLSTISCRPK